MRLGEALGKLNRDFRQKFLGECLDGRHCPEADTGGFGTGFAAPTDVGNANAEGVATTICRSDHVHNHPHFEWVCPPHFINTNAQNSVANRAFLAATFVKFRCQALRLGCYVIDPGPAGNIQLGLYGPYPSWALVCATGAIGCGTLTGNQVNWFSPTTTPQIEDGFYWAGCVCDQNYNAGVAGLRWGYFTSQALNDWIDSIALGGAFLTPRMDGAYPLPTPFVPVNDTNTRKYQTWLRVTV